MTPRSTATSQRLTASTGTEPIPEVGATVAVEDGAGEETPGLTIPVLKVSFYTVFVFINRTFVSYIYLFCIILILYDAAMFFSCSLEVTSLGSTQR